MISIYKLKIEQNSIKIRDIRTCAYGHDGTRGRVISYSPIIFAVTKTSTVASVSDMSRILPEGYVSTENYREGRGGGRGAGRVEERREEGGREKGREEGGMKEEEKSKEGY